MRVLFDNGTPRGVRGAADPGTFQEVEIREL